MVFADRCPWGSPFPAFGLAFSVSFEFRELEKEHEVDGLPKQDEASRSPICAGYRVPLKLRADWHRRHWD